MLGTFALAAGRRDGDRSVSTDLALARTCRFGSRRAVQSAARAGGVRSGLSVMVLVRRVTGTSSAEPLLRVSSHNFTTMVSGGISWLIDCGEGRAGDGWGAEEAPART